MEEFKRRQRAMWAAGDYATLSEYIRDVGVLVVERAGVDARMDVLDVQVLGERFADLRADIIEIWGRWNEAEDGRLRLPQEYLLSIVRL